MFDLAAIGAGLPVAAAQDELEQAAASGAFVVTAPPGTGKTTFIPPLIANRTTGLTLVTQPRRVAVRAAARRIAQLDGTRLGESVGFTVRGQREVTAATRLEMLTPGVLLRRLLRGPELDGVGAVLIDEVHERSLDTDLLLGMLAEARVLRDDLLVGAMSATLQADQVADLLDGAPVVEIPSALHPLEVQYAPPNGPRLDARGVTRDFLSHIARVAVDARTHADGDVLVFVPSARDVDEVTRRIREQKISEQTDAPRTRNAPLEVLPLHGRLPAAQQDRATSGRRPGDPPRIIVSTSLAESSLTVPGVRVVVDAGLDRQVRRDRGRDMTGLVTVSASRASAEQRAGRAARQAPGLAIRAFDESDFARMPAQAPPEITAADLTDAALQLACWGTPRAGGLALLTPPPPAEIDTAEKILQALELVDADGAATPLGREAALLPVGVREARALLEGTTRLPGSGAARLAAETVAALAGEHRADGADLPALVRNLRRGGPSAAGWRREAQRLERIARERTSVGMVPVVATSEAEQIGAVLAFARPDRIARRVAPGSRQLLLASGTRAALPEGSSLLSHDWVAVWEVQRAEGRAADRTGAIVRTAAPLTEADALSIGAPLITERRAASWAGGTVRVRMERALGAIELSSTPVAATAADTVPALLERVRTHGLATLTWSPAAASLRARLALLHRQLGVPWPDVSDAALAATLDTWLAPAVTAAHGRLEKVDVTAALRTLLPWPDAARLDELAPERLAIPSGSTARIDYPDPSDSDPTDPDAAASAPVVAVKLQELFGLAETPRLVDGRVPVVFHLLSPARRPLAVTADLRSFWDGPYQEVRKEMRGRYPKHPWPEDPWTAVATARTRPRN